jgi:3-mercaptopyruvate sulfurtransferase SseA
MAKRILVCSRCGENFAEDKTFSAQQQLNNHTRVCRQKHIPPAQQAKCRWTVDEDGTWYSACGEAHVFTTGTPKGNGYIFCPYCGKGLEQANTLNEHRR